MRDRVEQMSSQIEKKVIIVDVDNSNSSGKMNPKLRRLIQTFCVVLLVSYTTLLAYQSLSRATINNSLEVS